jgi:sugar/nucleoside kinase (ribokinase family)
VSDAASLVVGPFIARDFRRKGNATHSARRRTCLGRGYNDAMPAPEFVAIGHVTLDRFGDEVRPGGAALYAAITADRLGLSAGILTSHADDFPLELVPPRIEVVSVPALATTVFEHAHARGDRVLRVTSVADALGEADVPEDWRAAGLVLLAPVMNELDARVASVFGDASVAAEAQGWLRGLGQDGAVRTVRWDAAAQALRSFQAIFLSAADVRGQEQAMTEWVQRVPIAVVTAGRRGALLYVNGDRYEVRPRRAAEVDPTGAGDVFAATFLTRYRRDGDPWEAAEAATCAASLSVEGVGWSAVPDAARLDAALKDYRSVLP